MLFLLQDGAFLVRPSDKKGQPFTLVLMFAGNAKNIPIRKRADSRFALGTAKDNEEVCSNDCS